MKYPYIVVRNGIWYPSGIDVPEDTFPDFKKTTFSKTEINRMPIAELKELAEKEGIDEFGEKTGAELKKLLIAKYEL